MNNIEFRVWVFNLATMFIYLAYFAVFFGILYIDQRYIRVFSTCIQFGVCIFLIVRFFPWKTTHEITKFDVSIIFYFATFLLMNVVFVEIYSYNTFLHTTIADNIYNIIEKR